MADSEPVDLEKTLIALGADEKKAHAIRGHMNGIDYLNLINLIDDDSPEGRTGAKKLLAKYGIKIKDTQMESKRLESIFQNIHKGKTFEEADNTEFVRPISEMNIPGAALSGYSNFVRAGNDDDAQAIMDWLEENEFDFQNNDKHTFLVQCSDRENTYRLNHFMANRNGKTAFMDELHEDNQTLVANLKKAPFKGQFGEIIATEFGPIKVFGAEQTKTPTGAPDWNIIGTDKAGKVHRIQYDTANAGLYGRGGKHEFDEAKMAKNHIPASGTNVRNPVAQAGRMKGGAGAHASARDKDAKRDAWDRNAKHKNKYMGESAFTQGQIVRFGESEVPVRVPAGPNGTVGVELEGRVKMVKENEIEIISEGILGMTKIDPLYRLKELAGVKASPSVTLEAEPLADVGDIDVADDFDSPMGGGLEGDADFDAGNDLDGMGDDFGGAEFGAPETSIADPMGIDDTMADPIAAPVDTMDTGDNFGMGSDVGMDPMGGAPIMAAPVNSEAYNQILDHLNNIQTSLGDVKLSEYRTLVAKLEDLAGQVRMMGRDYLGEMRKLKK